MDDSTGAEVAALASSMREILAKLDELGLALPAAHLQASLDALPLPENEKLGRLIDKALASKTNKSSLN